LPNLHHDFEIVVHLATGKIGRGRLVMEDEVSIKNRIDEAEILWSQGRKEGAWVQTLQ
jgi:hypothetical protein